EDARLGLAEHAVARQRPEHTLKCVGVGAGRVGKLRNRSRAAAERVGDPELGNDPERSGGKCAAEKIPNARLGSLGCHRAARTAFATSSTSESASVRQSSSRRPSRTIPTTAGSPARRRAPSSSSTAHAKLGSSVSGSAPPPTRPTVSSRTPPHHPPPPQPPGPRANLPPRPDEHPQNRNLAKRPAGLLIQRERPFERRERELVCAKCALKRMGAQSLDPAVAADHDSGLWPPEQLVPREPTEV